MVPPTFLVTATFENPDGTTPTGVVTFTPQARSTPSSTVVPSSAVVATLSAGVLSKSLVSGVAYSVQEQITNQINPPVYTIPGTGNVDLSTVVLPTPNQISATNYAGTWSSATTYQAGQIVTYGGSSYVALVASTGTLPGSNASTWALLAGGADSGGQYGPLGLKIPTALVTGGGILGRIEVGAAGALMAAPIGDKAHVIAESRGQGPGVLDYVWMAQSAAAANVDCLEQNGRIRIFLDSETTPAVDLSINDFFMYAEQNDMFDAGVVGRTYRGGGGEANRNVGTLATYQASPADGKKRYLFAPFINYCRVEYSNQTAGAANTVATWCQAHITQLSGAMSGIAQTYKIFASGDTLEPTLLPPATDPGMVAQRTVTDMVTNATTTITSATAAFSAADVGRAVSGSADMPPGAYIASVTNATTALLNVAATGSHSGQTLNLLRTGVNPTVPVTPGQTTICDITGQGAGMLESVWVALRTNNNADAWIEGNFEIYVDGVVMPGWLSTGGEDFFDGAFGVVKLGGFPAGQGGAGGTGTGANITWFRFFTEQPIQFSSSLKIIWNVGQLGQGTWVDSSLGASAFAGVWLTTPPTPTYKKIAGVTPNVGSSTPYNADEFTSLGNGAALNGRAAPADGSSPAGGGWSANTAWVGDGAGHAVLTGAGLAIFDPIANFTLAAGLGTDYWAETAFQFTTPVIPLGASLTNAATTVNMPAGAYALLGSPATPFDVQIDQELVQVSAASNGAGNWTIARGRRVADNGGTGGVAHVAPRTVTDMVTNATTTITSATAAFTLADIGRSVQGTNIPANATITAVASATSATISAAATGSGSGGSLTIAPAMWLMSGASEMVFTVRRSSTGGGYVDGVAMRLQRISNYFWQAKCYDGGNFISSAKIDRGKNLHGQWVQLGLLCVGNVIEGYWKLSAETLWQPIGRWTTANGVSGQMVVGLDWFATTDGDGLVAKGAETFLVDYVRARAVTS